MPTRQRRLEAAMPIIVVRNYEEFFVSQGSRAWRVYRLKHNTALQADALCKGGRRLWVTERPVGRAAIAAVEAFLKQQTGETQ